MEPTDAAARERILLGPAAVVVAVGSAATHLLLAHAAAGRSLLTAALLVGMAAACLTCTPRLLRGGACARG